MYSALAYQKDGSSSQNTIGRAWGVQGLAPALGSGEGAAVGPVTDAEIVTGVGPGQGTGPGLGTVFAEGIGPGVATAGAGAGTDIGEEAGAVIEGDTTHKVAAGAGIATDDRAARAETVR